MKSILYQLQKYQQPTDSLSTTIKIEDKTTDDGLDIRHLASIIAGGDPILTERYYKRLLDLQLFPMAGKLYPYTVLARYHLYRQQVITSEEACDAEISAFIAQSNKEEYEKLFIEKSGGVVKKITLARALLATFGHTNPRSSLPTEFRKYICKLLDIPSTVSIKHASDILDSASKTANIEQLILGRFGYIILWHLLQKSNEQTSQLQLDKFACKLITSLPPGQAQGGTSRD